MILFLEARRNHEGSNWACKEVGGPQPCFCGQMLLTVMVNQPVMVSLSFGNFLADLLLDILLNHAIAMTVNCFIWRNKFLINSAITIKDQKCLT
jgi:hypothetical protein